MDIGKWILILWVVGGPTTATFDNKAACEFALDGAKQHFGVRTEGFCTPKYIADKH